MKEANSLYINGKWQRGWGDVFKSMNPATAKTLWAAPAADYRDVEGAVKAAEKAFEGWSQCSLDERMKYLYQFVDVLKNHSDDFAQTISEETGKPLWESKQEVGAMIRKVSISFEAYEDRCGQKDGEEGGAVRWTRFRPHGAVGVLGPFNLPGHLPHGHIIPALLAGNTVVFKPSELTPLVGEKYTALWQECDLPRGVFNMIQGGAETGSALVRHDGLKGIFFTGSFQTGQKIHEANAGKPQKILALEMGGSNPLIVDEMAHLQAACYAIIQSAFITSGQRCTCARRLILVESASANELLEMLVRAVEKIKVGKYTDRPEPFMGSVISQKAAEHIFTSWKMLVKNGGKALCAMKKLDDKAMLSPGMVDVTRMKSRQDEEIFGPLLQVIRVADLKAAIKEANNTEYGLAAGIFTEDAENYKMFYEGSRAGIVSWNRPTTGSSSQAPFGGIGKSGNHRPSAYFAADYCSYPVASLEQSSLTLPEELLPGVEI